MNNFSYITNFLFSTFLCKEKAPYEAKAAKRKAEYEKQIKAYNKKLVRLVCQFLLEDSS